MGRHHSRRKESVPTVGTAAPIRLPRDEHEERRVRLAQQRLQEIALQHVEWAHQRTGQAMEAGKYEEADDYSCTVALWMEQLTG